MATLSTRALVEQDGFAAKALGFPTGDVLFVDSTNGNNGNDGQSKRRPFLTLTYALTKAAAGDTIILNPGGSETVTATLAFSTANVKVICPVANPAAGFTVTGAGTLALATVSAAGVEIEGVKFAHTGATANAQCILTTNAADKLVVKNCLFDDSAIATTFTGTGVDVVNACDDVVVTDCRFLDQKFGVKFTMATGVTCSRPTVRNCTFLIGKSAAFGIVSALTGTGKVQGAVISNCEFLECNGDGAAATTAWDGTNGANATQGPIKFEAAVDQFIVRGCTAYSAANYSFDNLVSNAGAGDLIGNETAATVSGDIDSIYSDTTHIDSDVVRILSDTTHIDSDCTAMDTRTATIASDLVLMQAGYPIMLTGTKADIAGLPNNTQAAGGLLATATGGAVLIEDVILEKDSTALTGPTNVEITTDDTYGPTGAGDPIAVVAITALGANDRVGKSGTTTWTTLKFPLVLGSGKKLYAHGDDSAGTSAGNYRFTVIGRAANSSTTLV